MGGECSTHGNCEKCTYYFSQKLKRYVYLGDLGVDGYDINRDFKE